MNSEKSNFFSSVSLDLGVEIGVFPQGGRLTPPPLRLIGLNLFRLTLSRIRANPVMYIDKAAGRVDSALG